MEIIGNGLNRLFRCGLAIDLGTVNTLVYAPADGIILNEPSLIAVNKFNGKVIAGGRDALQMMGREPRDVVVHRPIERGVVTDYELTEQMLRLFFRRAGRSKVIPRRYFKLVVGTPNSATLLERRGIQTTVERARASRVSLVEEGIAAAIGAGVLFRDPHARLVVDIGGGTTNISIVTSAGAVTSHSVDVAGLSMDRAIADYIRQAYRVLIGEQSAELLKIRMGNALPPGNTQSMLTVGKSLIDNAPHQLEIFADELFPILDRPLRAILESVRLVMSEAPPDVSADLYSTGIILTGGGSLLQNLDVRLKDEINLPVTRAERPLEAVAMGAGYLLEQPALLERLQVSDEVPSWGFETEIEYTLAAHEAESV